MSLATSVLFPITMLAFWLASATPLLPIKRQSYACIGKPEGLADNFSSTGSIVVGGFTVSPDFQTTPGAFEPIQGPAGESFVARLSGDGSTLEFSTYWESKFTRLALTPNDSVVVLGWTSASSIPTTPGVIWPAKSFSFATNTFAKFSPDGSSLLCATWIDGPGSDLALLGDDSIVVAGTTSSTTAPGTILHISADAQALIGAATLTGGGILVVDVDSMGHVYASGATDSASFPATPGAFSTQLSGDLDVFVAKYSADLQSLLSATYLGSSQVVFGFEVAQAISVDPSGVVTIAGRP